MKKLFLLFIILQLGFFGSLEAQSLSWARETYLTIQEGIASYYGKKFHQRKTASGEIFDMHKYTAAHKYLPFGTFLKVTNLDNGYQVIVKINDRLPLSSKRVIDLSRNAADRIDMVQSGLAKVKLDVLSNQTIEKLKDYFDEIPGDLRLRQYQEPVLFVKNEDELLQNKFIRNN